jgi:dihydropteroate synthase
MIWRTRRRTFDLGSRGVIMGILNVTPDSFSDGGRFAQVDSAVEQALRMVEEGADIIDIGGESTRPGAEAVSADEEMARVIPVIEKLSKLSTVVLSIDTSKAAVARAAITAGASIINDVTALRGDPTMASVASESGAGLALMHLRGTPRTMQQNPQYHDVVSEVVAFLDERITAAKAAGLSEDRLAIDPGIGFGKTVEHNLQLIAGLEKFATLQRPVLLGVSRKSFLAAAAASPAVNERDTPTAALTALGYQLGARIFRVHAVRPNVQTLHLAESLASARQGAASPTPSYPPQSR